MEARSFATVGAVTRRKDGLAKVTGTEVYPSDMYLPYALHARVLRSPHPHARIVSIDTREAEKMGAICITADDVPEKRYNERQVSIPSKTYRDRTVLPRVVRQVGEGVVAVAARTEALAERAIRAIKVEYEVLPAVFDVHKAMEPDAPKLYENVLLGDVELPIENNVACAAPGQRRATSTVGFAEADLIVEREYQTGRVYHAQMETKSVVCRPRADGGLDGVADDAVDPQRAHLLGQIFDIPLSKIDVHRCRSAARSGRASR